MMSCLDKITWLGIIWGGGGGGGGGGGAALPVLCYRAGSNRCHPYVFLASPGEKHCWPTSAACWSPRHCMQE